LWPSSRQGQQVSEFVAEVVMNNVMRGCGWPADSAREVLASMAMGEVHNITCSNTFNFRRSRDFEKI
jgi:hypothetical protein